MNRRSYTSAPLSLAQVSAKAVHICPDAGAPLLLSGGGGKAGGVSRLGSRSFGSLIPMIS